MPSAANARASARAVYTPEPTSWISCKMKYKKPPVDRPGNGITGGFYFFQK
jgi:hypothetical protein